MKVSFKDVKVKGAGEFVPPPPPAQPPTKKCGGDCDCKCQPKDDK